MNDRNVTTAVFLLGCCLTLVSSVQAQCTQPNSVAPHGVQFQDFTLGDNVPLNTPLDGCIPGVEHWQVVDAGTVPVEAATAVITTGQAGGLGNDLSLANGARFEKFQSGFILGELRFAELSSTSSIANTLDVNGESIALGDLIAAGFTIVGGAFVQVDALGGGAYDLDVTPGIEFLDEFSITGNSGVAIDNVRFVRLPEPSSALISLIGSSLVIYRRRTL